MAIKKADLLRLKKLEAEKIKKQRAEKAKQKSDKAKQRKEKKVTPKKKTAITYKVGPSHSRQTRIKKCTICNGNPPLVPFELDDFKGDRCEICFEVVNYKPK